MLLRVLTTPWIVSESCRRVLHKKQKSKKQIAWRLLSISVVLFSGPICIIWPWSAWQQLSQQPCHTQSCCAGRREVWWRREKRRQWKSSCSRLEQWICRRETGVTIGTGENRRVDRLTKTFKWTTHADRETLVAGTTSTLFGWTKTDESHVTTRSPMRNFPGVAPPAPQMHTIWTQKGRKAAAEPRGRLSGLYRQTDHSQRPQCCLTWPVLQSCRKLTS